MRTRVELPKDDPQKLAQLDAEFIAKYQAGTIPAITPSPLDPATDPFGRNYEWLTTPPTPFTSVFDSLINLPATERIRVAGEPLRRAALGGSMASGSDEAVLQKWAQESFVAYCYTAGEEGEDILDMLKTEGDLAPDMVREVAQFLELHPAFALLSIEQRVVAAMVAIETLRPTKAE